MLVRSMSFGAAVVALLVVPLACGSFNADAPPTTGAEGGVTEGGPGVEGGAPPDGSSAEAGMPAPPFVLGTGYKNLRAIAATETDVFWIDQGSGGGIFTKPILGGQPRPLAMSSAASSLAIDGDHVYFTDPASRTVARIDIAGVEQVQMSPVEPAGGLAPSIVVAGPGAVAALIGSMASTGEVRQYNLQLVPTVTAANLMNPFSVTAFGTQLYWTEGGAGAVVRGDIGTTNRTVLFGENDAEAIAADGAGVYWTVPSKAMIRGSIGGATPITLALNEDEPRSIAADGTYVYWTTSKNELRRAGHLDNGTSSLFADGFKALTEMHVRAIAVTSQYVVWLTGDGRVLRASKQ
jgi:hypothetical protein